MAKNIDYAKLKALSQQIVECIGDCSEGEDPSLPTPENNDSKATPLGEGKDQGQGDVVDFLGGELGKGQSKSTGSDDDKKKKKESSLAMMGAVLASKIGK